MKLDKLQKALEETDRDAPLTVGVTEVVIELRDPVTGEPMFLDTFGVHGDFAPYKARIILTPQKKTQKVERPDICDPSCRKALCELGCSCKCSFCFAVRRDRIKRLQDINKPS
jgi:hypothetical protein